MSDWIDSLSAKGIGGLARIAIRNAHAQGCEAQREAERLRAGHNEAQLQTLADLSAARAIIADLERQAAGERLRVLEAWMSGHNSCYTNHGGNLACKKCAEKHAEIAAERAKLEAHHG